MAVDDAGIDPVEDFLFNRKRGHCEYFASALALMLRALEIPSRLVTGFKGADPLGTPGYYEVQQRHAHAWVEAYVDGRWMILDPTPADRDEIVRERASGAGFWKSARSSLTSLWATYVVSLSLNRQQESLYDPLQGSVTSGWGALRRMLQGLGAAGGDFKAALESPQRLLTPRNAVLAMTLILAAFVLFRLVRRLMNGEAHRAGGRAPRGWLARFGDWLARILAGRPPDPARVIVAFYEHYQALVRAAGLTPRHDQTQREFAQLVEQALSGKLDPAGLRQFPTQLAELFYRVRFGAGSLQPRETEEIEQQLMQLKRALS
jgi:hypothetical protein